MRSICLAVVAAAAMLVCASAAASAPASLIALDPFLVAPDHLGNMELASFLAGNPDLQSYAARAISADGTSAAILLFETDSNSPVTVQTSDAASLVAYADNFLTTPPAAGKSSLKITKLIQSGSNWFAPVLVQGPLGSYSSNNVIELSATQGTGNAGLNVALVIPPVVLVHGLWGNRKSLSEAEKFLQANAPWNSAPDFVAPICYSKYLRFDAKNDPLSGQGDPCEVTSKAALQTEIDSLLATLDSDQIVGARVDLLVHSMGGLVARNYASQKKYESLRNRMQGQFHAIVTLNTPEIGSRLAPALIKKRDNRRKAPLTTFQGLAWEALCGNATFGKCLAANGDPINAPGLPVKTGAVYSLDPNGPALNNPNLSGPNIANATWRAVSSTRPGNSALAFAIDTLIAALYKNPDGRNVPTVDSILGNVPDDAIVTVKSQTNGATSKQLYTFAKLSHTGIPRKILQYLVGVNDHSVVHDPSGEVEQLAACWIETTGADSCLPAKAEIAAEEAAPATPQFLKPLAGMHVAAPLRATLGTPFEATLHLLVSRPPVSISVWQQGESDRTTREVITPSWANGAVRLRMTPKLLGPVQFNFRAEFADGAVAARTVQIFTAPPAAPPLAFKANDLPVLVLTLDSDTASATPQPTAVYPAPVGQLALNPRFVEWLAPQPGAPVIHVDRNGLIQALRPGEARIEARFGRATAVLRVIVRTAQQ
ncbi:MAG TPA: alpha/beta fold hydrolase [Rhizomicrobium sp.]|jgi:pimeloyl-ACP methyl ester carboxylesterase|nr:alpha/beta fold hydrolase [Rhizomicrobium sp.]